MEFRKDYHIARDLVAKELIEKYGLVESYRHYEILTLDSTNYSFHFTFIVPEEEEVRVSLKGKEWLDGKSSSDLMYDKYDSMDGVQYARKKFKAELRKRDLPYMSPAYLHFSMIISFLEIEHSDYFL
ncbi:MAG: hypothetical protein GQ574_28555 [Crocinitomix sp.]|nr:hypothetical protein [Crocinitomix sp.]